MTAGVYIVRNKIDGKVYVGSATKVAQRLQRHRADLGRGKHPNKYLQRAFDKHGADNFVFEVLFLCSAEDRLKVEQSYMDLYRSTQEEYGYNLIPTRESQLFGEAISKYQKDGWAKLSVDERKKKAAHLNATRKKALQLAAIARDTPEHRAMLSERAFKTVASPATRKKNSERLKKLWQDPVFRAARIAGLEIGRNKTNARRKPR